MSQRDDLTPEQARVLAHLEQAHPDARSARDIAEALGLDVLDALTALWTLSRLGYARLRPGDPDARPEAAEYEAAGAPADPASAAGDVDHAAERATRPEPPRTTESALS